MGLTQVEKEDNFLFQSRGMWNTTDFFIFHYLSKIVTFTFDKCSNLSIFTLNGLIWNQIFLTVAG